MARRRSHRLRNIILGTIAAVLLAPIFMLMVYRIAKPPITPLMVIRLLEVEGIKKVWFALSRISPHVRNSVIALEDSGFCEHSGFDWGQLFEALSEYYNKGERLRGASTISMQTTKNLFLWPQRGMVRKVLEAPLTIVLEALWDKPRILEVYLNIVEWGPGIYGVEAAAHAYFRKPAAQLTSYEAALLAAVLPNPRRWSPANPTRYITNRVYTATARIRRLGERLDCVRR